MKTKLELVKNQINHEIENKAWKKRRHNMHCKVKYQVMHGIENSVLDLTDNLILKTIYHEN